MTRAGSDRRGLILLAMTVANAMVLVDQTAVPLILPSIIQRFGVGSQQVQWVLNASLLPLAGLLVFGGRLGDLIGRRRVFLLGSTVFAGASVCAGLAPTFPILLVFRVLQGAGGALMLPTTIAIVSAAYPGSERGRALGTMGGAAAVAGACGPVIGGVLTSALGWRSVLLINAPLAVLAAVATLRSVPADPVGTDRKRIDIAGTSLLSITLIGFVLGLTQSQVWGWTSVGVLLPLAASLGAGIAFVLVERRIADPLLEFGLLRRYPNYLGSTISQGIAGMAEMGLGLLFPLLLILNLGMSPGLAGLALIPTTVPMVVVAPMAGRWYDRGGGRPPLTTGFGILALAGVVLAVAVHAHNYWVLFPGLAIFGTGLALVLTVNDPVSLDTLPEEAHGEASGVSATAEQFGGAVGISLLYLVFHSTYVDRLHANVSAGPFTDLTPSQFAQLRTDIVAAEQTGLHPSSFDPRFTDYLHATLDASNTGFSVAFTMTSVLSIVALLVVWRLVRKPPAAPATEPGQPSIGEPGAGEPRAEAAER
jgi:EmrB/QacA subfamily drug resistance transporter